MLKSIWLLIGRQPCQPIRSHVENPCQLITILTHCGLVTPYGIIELGQHQFRLWLVGCLMAPYHYLNHCWQIISEVLWHSCLGNFSGNAQDINPWYESDKDWLKIIAWTHRDHWVLHIFFLVQLTVIITRPWYSVQCNNSKCIWKIIFTEGQFWPSGIVVAFVRLSVCPSVSPCVNPEFVCAITCHPFKLESHNLNQH